MAATITKTKLGIASYETQISEQPMNDAAVQGSSPLGHLLRRSVRLLGPGVVVMLADTDAGSVITVSQSGARWGYRLLALQVLLIPCLFVAQELTVRLALCTQRGFGELVTQHFGRGLARFSMATLLISCFGGLLTEISGLAEVGQLFGVPIWLSATIVCGSVCVVVWTGNHLQVERLALALGTFELAFFVVAWAAHPRWSDLASQLMDQPLHSPGYLYLIAANIGTTVMPWMLFYQQTALLGKGLGPADLRAARIDTLGGAVLCQIVTVAVLVGSATAFNGSHQSLSSVPQIAAAFTSALGSTIGRLVFALALSGSALVAMLIIGQSTMWALQEMLGRKQKSALSSRLDSWFGLAFAALLFAAGILVSSGVSLVRLSLATGVLNALILPVILGLLMHLTQRVLPEHVRLRAGHAIGVSITLIATCIFGLYAGLGGIL